MYVDKIVKRLSLRARVGILLSAKHQGHIDRIKPNLDQMAQLNYFVSPALYTAAMKASGER